MDWKERPMKFRVVHTNSNEVVAFREAYEVEEYLCDMASERYLWTPVFQGYESKEGEFTLGIHDDTFDSEPDDQGYVCYSVSGERIWYIEGYRLDDDEAFWTVFQDQFHVKVETIA